MSNILTTKLVKKILLITENLYVYVYYIYFLIKI